MYLYKSQYEAVVGDEASPTFDELAVPWASEKPARIVLDAMACLVMGVCAIDNLDAFARQMNLHLLNAFRKSGDIEGARAILQASKSAPQSPSFSDAASGADASVVSKSTRPAVTACRQQKTKKRKRKRIGGGDGGGERPGKEESSPKEESYSGMKVC